MSLTPQEDLFAEGTETVSVTLFNTSGYDAGPGTNALVSLADDEAAPPPLSLRLTNPTTNLLDLTLTGPATRVFALETSTNLIAWEAFATLVSTTNSARLIDLMPTNTSMLFFRARE